MGRSWFYALMLGVASGAPALGAPASGGDVVEFNRDIRPILSDHCFACHGPDEKQRKGDLRLDLEENAFADLGGYHAIVPGDSPASELFRRITAEETSERMPPKKFDKPLSAEQVALIKAWIDQGATWQGHWSFIPPAPRPPPAVEGVAEDVAGWPRNDLDRFILDRLVQEGLTPSPEADKRTLIRRVTLDLTGLPPTPAEVEAFVGDTSPDAYEKVVDRLLASPHYAERMTVQWLDLARYADTHGYHIDSHRDMWRWRDWVIDAFDKNKPYDEFTLAQIAGDLLPDATDDQRLATGFNRNHMINYEGGAIPEEYLNAYIVDRVNTTSTVWLGLTMACAQCHDHKYDPITQRDFYRFYAFFNHVPENGLDGRTGNAPPVMKAPLPDQQTRLEAIRAELASAEASFKSLEPKLAEGQAAWERATLAGLAPPPADALLAHFELDGHTADTSGRYHHGRGVGEELTYGEGRIGRAAKFTTKSHIELGNAGDFERTDAFSYGAWVRPENQESMAVIAKMHDADHIRGYDLFLSGGKLFVHLIHAWDGNAIRVNTKDGVGVNAWYHVMMTYDGSSKAAGIRLYVDGALKEVEVTHDNLTDTIRTDKPLHIGRRKPSVPFRGLIDDVRVYGRLLTPEEVRSLARDHPFRTVLAAANDRRTQAEKNDLRTRYMTQAAPAEIKEPYERLAALRKQEQDVLAEVPTSMVMAEMAEPRPTYVLVRGDYATHGEAVTAGTPASLPPLPADAPGNRLGLARWLVSRENPLTARVAVNRYWQMYFGTGLVKTSDDFGAQGEWPSHPELLDWLATRFVDSGWDVKALQRLIVTSAAYRQSSRVTPALLEQDPSNRLLTRGARLRLPAEFIRDNALFVGGLLVPDIGGPSVKPYQPAHLWKEVAYGGQFTAQVFVQDTGRDLYRRSMYTFWKRTSPPPSFATFDAPNREVCVASRARTNTPLQALVLMNDPTYVEASRHFAVRILREGGATLEDRTRYAFTRAVARPPSQAEIDVLRELYHAAYDRFFVDIDAAISLLNTGESGYADDLNLIELAAWTSVANVILNLDETITKG